MLHVRIVAVGGIKESFYSGAIAEYVKRLQKYCKLEIIEVGESTLEKEAGAIIAKLKGHVILCDINGTLVTSVDLAKKIESISQFSSVVTFVIGGSDGVGNHLDSVVFEKISFGRITLPHQLFRVLLVEQVYRAFTINRGEKYHK